MKEAEAQKMLFEWAAIMYRSLPGIELLFHIPNGGSRSGPIEGKHLKDQGVKAGVPDLFLPVPRGKYHGMFIEMKRDTKSKLRPEQRQWLDALMEQGYMTAVAYGYEDAVYRIQNYLNKEKS